MKENMIRKLTSRKFWLAVTAFISMLVVALGYTDSQAAKVTALIMAGADVIAYIIGEGMADSAPTNVTLNTTNTTEETDDLK